MTKPKKCIKTIIRLISAPAWVALLFAGSIIEYLTNDELPYVQAWKKSWKLLTNK